MTDRSTPSPTIDGEKLCRRLHRFGEIGRDARGRLSRLAATDADRRARDQLVTWMRELELAVTVDTIGNIIGCSDSQPGQRPIMIGSHIDTVVDAGIYDGSYGVLAGLAVVEALSKAGAQIEKPIAVAAFTNEEGARFSPDMMGSLVFAGGLEVDRALSACDRDGATLGGELARIGYAGSQDPGHPIPAAFLELHVEQGPVLETGGLTIGVVEKVQGISWQKITIEGRASHAGTTPVHLRRDAGLAAARIITFLRECALETEGKTVATVGRLELRPNVVNVVPGEAELTVDIRDADDRRLRAVEDSLSSFLETLRGEEQVEIETESLVRLEPVDFDRELVGVIEEAAARQRTSFVRMTSGAGHDAQMLARVCPSAMIFVPSHGGLSHNPNEFTDPHDLVTGAEVLLDVVSSLVCPS